MPPLLYVRLFCNNRVFMQENKLKRQRLKKDREKNFKDNKRPYRAVSVQGSIGQKAGTGPHPSLRPGKAVLLS